MSKTASFWLVAAMTAVVASPAAAQDADRDKARALIAQVLNGGQATSPATAVQAATTGPTVELTSEQAVARALDKNLTLASERITPETWDLQISAAMANYLPNLTSGFSNQSAVQLNTNLFAGGNRVTQDNAAWSGGLAQNVWWGGGNYVINFTNNRAASDATNSTVNPNYQSGLQAQYVQPLLRNFKIDNNRLTITSAKLSQDTSELSLKATTASTVAQVRNAYWELVYARQAVDAAQASLDLASKLVADNRSRVEIGTMAPIDVVQAQADEATRRQTLVNAQATLRNDELALKRLIVSGTDDELWRATLVPTDLPTSAPQAIDLEGAVQIALNSRTDLATTRKSLELADAQMRNRSTRRCPSWISSALIPSTAGAARGSSATPRLRPTSSTPSPAAISTRCAASARSTRRPGTRGSSSRFPSGSVRRRPTWRGSGCSAARPKRRSRPRSSRSRPTSRPRPWPSATRSKRCRRRPPPGSCR